jgi:hypothetical protein
MKIHILLLISVVYGSLKGFHEETIELPIDYLDGLSKTYKHTVFILDEFWKQGEGTIIFYPGGPTEVKEEIPKIQKFLTKLAKET